MVAQTRIPKTPVTLSGKLQQLFSAPGADFGLALVNAGGEQGTAMRITRANFKQLSDGKAIDRHVTCRCVGEGVWSVQTD